jgi:hypothetical protein
MYESVRLVRQQYHGGACGARSATFRGVERKPVSELLSEAASRKRLSPSLAKPPDFKAGNANRCEGASHRFDIMLEHASAQNADVLRPGFETPG